MQIVDITDKNYKYKHINTSSKLFSQFIAELIVEHKQSLDEMGDA